MHFLIHLLNPINAVKIIWGKKNVRYGFVLVALALFSMNLSNFTVFLFGLPIEMFEIVRGWVFVFASVCFLTASLLITSEFRWLRYITYAVNALGVIRIISAIMLDDLSGFDWQFFIIFSQACILLISYIILSRKDWNRLNKV
jgi:hypothetical protein